MYYMALKLFLLSFIVIVISASNSDFHLWLYIIVLNIIFGLIKYIAFFFEVPNVIACHDLANASGIL